MGGIGGTFNQFLWGGSGGSGTPTAGVTLASLLQPILRIAGITWMPGTTPSIDQYGELIPMINRMLASYSLDGHRVFTATLQTHLLTAGQKVYTIGPGAQFDRPRPIFISAADILYPTDPVLRQPIRAIYDEEEWLQISIQDITAAPPMLIYYNNDMDENGWAKIYVFPQPPDGYSLELATWLQLPSGFTSVDDIVLLPPGYEEMIVWNGAVRCAGMYPLESKLLPDARDMAAKSLMTVVTLNSRSPQLRSEAAFINQKRAKRSSMTPFGWWLS